MIHKNRNGSVKVSYKCRNGQHEQCRPERIALDLDVVCHCDDPACTHPIECNRSCEKSTVHNRPKAKSYTSVEDMGY